MNLQKETCKQGFGVIALIHMAHNSIAMSAAKTGSYNFWMDQAATSKQISHQLHTYTSPKIVVVL